MASENYRAPSVAQSAELAEQQGQVIVHALADAYAAGAEGLQFGGLARMEALAAALAATGKQQVGEVQGDESPMAKMAAALRGKAEAEKAAFDQRVQSGEWGPMPDARTQADFCQLCDGSGWDGESREKKCQSCSGEGLAARQPGAWQQRTRFCNSNGEWSEWAPFDPRHGFPERVGKNEQPHDAEYRPLFLGPTAQGIDLGPVRELLRRRMAQWRSHLPSDPGAPGTVAISGDGEGGYNNDVRMYREGIALMDQVLALIDDQRDAAPGVGE